MANPPVANLFDAFDAGVVDPSKWTVASGVWAAPSGQLCATMPATAAINSTGVFSLHQSLAFVEVATFNNGGGAAAGTSTLRIFNNADATDFVEIVINASTTQITFRWLENNVVQVTSTIAYNSTSMRWIRIREVGGTVFFETAPDGSTWVQRFTSTSQTWISAIKVQLGASQTGGAAITKCFDNFNVAPASSRAVAVGSEFVVSTDGKLGLNRCDQSDMTWPYVCSQSAYNALRRSENPCGLWVQPPAQQHVDVTNRVLTTSDQGEQTLITLTLTNPDTCRTMLYYLPAVAGFKVNQDSDTTGVFNWSLGIQVTGVDNPDVGFTPIAANDFGFFKVSHLWRGEADYYWTADPGASTTVVVKLKVFAGGGDAKLTQLQARLGYIGWSLVNA